MSQLAPYIVVTTHLLSGNGDLILRQKIIHHIKRNYNENHKNYLLDSNDYYLLA